MDGRLLAGEGHYGASSSYGSLSLPSDAPTPRSRSRARVITVAGLVLVGLAMTAVVATMASRTGYQRVRSAMDADTFRPGQISDTMTIKTNGRPASPVLWKRINDGPLRPFQFESDALGAQRGGSSHEDPRQNGLWTVDTKNDYSLLESQWKVHHVDAPNEGGDDGTWRAGYKWAIDNNAVLENGWGPCYPACGDSVKFRDVVCIRSDETVVADTFCTATKPTLHAGCKNYSLCHPCWEVQPWSACGGDAEPGRPTCNQKNREVRCRFCENDVLPQSVRSPLHKIAWEPRNWEGAIDTGQGVSGGALVMGRESFAAWFAKEEGIRESQVTADHVCLYGKVGICDMPIPDGCSKDSTMSAEDCQPSIDNVAQEREMPAYFCGFNVRPEDCTLERSKASGRHDKYQSVTIQNGYDCNTMAKSISPESMAFLEDLEGRQTHALKCDDNTNKSCRDWTSPFHESYPNVPYHMLGPFDSEFLRPLKNDGCINFEDSGGAYKWWYMEWDDPRVTLCYNDTWWNEEQKRWWYGCLEEDIDGWSDPEDPEDLLRLGAPFEQVDLFAPEHDIQRQTCGMGFDARPFRCCRKIEVGRCEQTDQRCYCTGAHTVFDQDAHPFNHDPASEGEIHTESYCPLMNDQPLGVFSRMFSDIAVVKNEVTGAMEDKEVQLLPVIRREKCDNFETVWECDKYPNQNQLWPPEEYTIGANAADAADFEHTAESGPFYRLLETWIEQYNSYDETLDNFGIVGFDGAGEYGMGCLRQQLEHTCTRAAQFDNCTGVWQCNCWRECDGTGRVTSKQDPGYILPRDGSEETESYPADGEVDVGEEGMPDWRKVTDRTECMECKAECGMTSHQCRQCWCEYLPTDKIVQYGHFQNPGSPAVLNGDYTHMAQYAYSEIDPTGSRCYRPWEGYGTPKPEEVRECVNPEACVFVWCIDEHFGDCGLGCGPQHETRSIACCRMDGVVVDTGLCEPNPLGTQWELIMQMGMEDTTTNRLRFDGEYWEDAELTLNPKCASSKDRKLHAFNSRKYNKMKMCFGYGFTLVNADFEDDALSQGVEEVTSMTGWGVSGSAFLINSCAKRTATGGSKLLALGESNTISAQISGLTVGMLTEVTFSLGTDAEPLVLGDGSHLELASATVVINNGETIDIAEVPRGGLRDYTFHFTPLEKEASLTIQERDGCAEFCLLIDNVRVTTKGFEILAQEFDETASSHGGYDGATLANLNRQFAQNALSPMGDPSPSADADNRNFNIGPSTEWGGDWDEIMIVSGDNHDLSDSNGDGEADKWYIFRPSASIFDDDYAADMAIADLRSNDAELMAATKEAGGAKMCRQPEGTESAWSINPLTDEYTHPALLLNGDGQIVNDGAGGCASTVCEAFGRTEQWSCLWKVNGADMDLESSSYDDFEGLDLFRGSNPSSTEADLDSRAGVAKAALESWVSQDTGDFDPATFNVQCEKQFEEVDVCTDWGSRGRGVYYAGSKWLGGFIGWRGDTDPKGYSAMQFDAMQASRGNDFFDYPLLQIFARKSNSHGATDETQANCIVYTFAASFQNATTLFTMGEIATPSMTLTEDKFYKREWQRIFGKSFHEGGSFAEDGSLAGFNLGVDNYKCSGPPSFAADAGDTHFVRWGIKQRACGATGDGDAFASVAGVGIKSSTPTDASGRYSGCGEVLTSPSQVEDGYTTENMGAGTSLRWQEENTVKAKNAWIWIADSTQNLPVDGFKLLTPANWNEPGFMVLSGSANRFPTVDGCKRKCAEMEDCVVGSYISGKTRHGECWLASRMANASDTEWCGSEADKVCTAFEKMPVLTMRTCNAYVYESHMVLPGGEDWDLNKFFSTGVIFEVKEGQDQYAETVFGPVTTREVLSKSFSYGKQTYVYWIEDVVNLATLRSKCVFTQKRSIDKPKFQQWPGRIVQCSMPNDHIFNSQRTNGKFMSTVAAHKACTEAFLGHREGDIERDEVTGALAVNFDTEVHESGGDCHGFSEWVTPELLVNGDFEEKFPQVDSGAYIFGAASEGMFGWWVGIDGDGNSMSVAVETITKDEEAIYPLAPPAPFSCATCTRFVDLNADGAGEIYQEFGVRMGATYALSMWVSADYVGTGNAVDTPEKSARIVIDSFDPDTPALEAVIKIDAGGWDAKSYRWKHFMWEFTPTPSDEFMQDYAGDTSLSKITISSLNPGISGIMVDAISIKESRPFEVDDGTGSGDFVPECAIVGTDFDVELVPEDVLHTFSLRDRQLMQKTMCASINDEGQIVFPAWHDCAGTVGAITGAMEDSGPGRFRNCGAGDKAGESGGAVWAAGDCDTAFTQTFGGASTVMSPNAMKKTIETFERGEDEEPLEVSIWDQAVSQETWYLAGRATPPSGAGTVLTPWENPHDVPGIFVGFQGFMDSAGSLTVYCFKLSFGHKATILNVRIGGSKFIGSRFQLLTAARTPVSTRDINVNDGHFEASQCSGSASEPGYHCIVMLSGSPVHAEKVYYFEETNSEPIARVRSSFCVRTPIAYLHAESDESSYDMDPHSKAPAEGPSCKQVGLMNRIDTLNEDFRTQVVEDKCVTVDMSPEDFQGHLWYPIPKDMGEGRYAKIDLVHDGAETVNIGLFDHEQAYHGTAAREDSDQADLLAALQIQAAKDPFTEGITWVHEGEEEEADTDDTECTSGEDPAYVVRLETSKICIYKLGLPMNKCEDEVALGFCGAELACVRTADIGETLPVEIGRDDNGVQMRLWVDQFYDESDDSWSIRVGRPASGKDSSDPASFEYDVQQVAIGSDVLLQYKVPVEEEVVSVSHMAIMVQGAGTSNFDAQLRLNVCTGGEVGRPEGERTCVDWSGCKCDWLDPSTEVNVCVTTQKGCTDGKVDGVHQLQDFDIEENIPCSNMCGNGDKKRTTDCVIREHERKSTLCRSWGTECPIFVHTSNPVCSVTFFSEYADGFGPDLVSPAYLSGERSLPIAPNLPPGGPLSSRANIAELDIFKTDGTARRYQEGWNPRSFMITGNGCMVTVWADQDGWKDYDYNGFGEYDATIKTDPVLVTEPIVRSYRVVVGDKLIVGSASKLGIRGITEGAVAPTFYEELPRDANNEFMKINSYSVSGLNDNLCRKSDKPATVISCYDDRGCCYVAVYGMWHEGEGNTQESEGETQFCMNMDRDCDCDDEIGIECRQVAWEKRKYECTEWKPIAPGMESKWDLYYLRDTDLKRERLEQTMLDWAQAGDSSLDYDYCAVKSHVLTEEYNYEQDTQTYADQARQQLTRWQFAEGCPETVNGYGEGNEEQVYGAVAKGSMYLEHNEFKGDPDKVNFWECSGDAYWYGPAIIGGGDPKVCPGPVENHPANVDSTGGFYPQRCRNCGREYTEHWCKCEWRSDDWAACEGCGDVLLSRKVYCVREDHSDSNQQVRECTQSTLDTYGRCCYSPLFSSSCGGCTNDLRHTSQKHCMTTNECSYEWHVKVNDEVCDTFNKCVPWSEWIVDDRAQSTSKPDMKEWCTSGPQRGDTNDAFVTYGLGACWLPTTREHNPSFQTAMGSWGVNGFDECLCYYGTLKGPGLFTFGPDPLPIGPGTKVAQRVEMQVSGWVTEISVAVDGLSDGSPTSVKGALYTDALGQPGQRISVTKTTESSNKRQWVSMGFTSMEADNIPTEFKQAAMRGTYLSAGFYWIAINIDKAAQFLGFPDNAEGTEGMLQVTEGFKPGNTIPALEFGGDSTTVAGSFSVHASVVADADVHVYPDRSQPCPSAEDCEECMRTTDSRGEFEGQRCGWLTAAAASGSAERCLPRLYMQANGMDEDLSCHSSWGEGMYMELENWYCTGEAGPPPALSDPADTVEECAELCKLANTQWYQYAGWGGAGAGAQQPFYCKGFTFQENADTAAEPECTLYKELTTIEPTVSYRKDAEGKFTDEVVTVEMTRRCFVPKEQPNACIVAGSEWYRSNEGEYYYQAKDGFLYQVARAADGGVPECDNESIFGGQRLRPRRYCNGFAQDSEVDHHNAPDMQCSKCIAHALRHNLLAGKITGGTEGGGGCSALAMHHAILCPGDDTAAKLRCDDGGVMHINRRGATYGRRDVGANSIQCPGDTLKGRSEAAGTKGNVDHILSPLCDGKKECAFIVSDESLWANFPEVDKYLEVSWRCI